MSVISTVVRIVSRILLFFSIVFFSLPYKVTDSGSVSGFDLANGVKEIGDASKTLSKSFGGSSSTINSATGMAFAFLVIPIICYIIIGFIIPKKSIVALVFSELLAITAFILTYATFRVADSSAGIGIICLFILGIIAIIAPIVSVVFYRLSNKKEPLLQ